jgi:hypothetical protein
MKSCFIIGAHSGSVKHQLSPVWKKADNREKKLSLTAQDALQTHADLS